MNRRDFQRAFGDVPEDFHLRLQETLDGLEEKNMKKKYKLSTVLIAAVLIIPDGRGHRGRTAGYLRFPENCRSHRAPAGGGGTGGHQPGHG